MGDGVKRRGFASMTPDRRREIASKGGKNVPAEKRTYSKSPEIAAKSGKKGGAAVPAEERMFSKDRRLASESGKKGGRARSALFENREE